MALDSTPWFVGGGAEHSPEVARLLAYAATAGAEGVVGVGDLKVTAQPVPNGTVAVVPGAGLVANRYPGGGSQTYVVRNATQTDAPVTPTGSAGARTDLVVVRVLDPQYEGAPPVDPTDFDYARIEVIQGVPDSTLTARELMLGYPAIALAKIRVPASTATITAAMITDLRQVANPRRERAMVAVFPTAALNVPTTPTVYGAWPVTAAQQPRVDVPVWATRLDIVVHISGAKYVKGSGTLDTVAGIITSFGGNLSENGIIIQDAEDSGGRYHYTLVGSHVVTAAMRGTVLPIVLQARRTAGTGVISADTQTTVAIDWEFSEGAQ